MGKLRKAWGFYCAAAVLAGAFLATCDMGLGPTVDLEPPELVVESITLPDGFTHRVEQEDGGKLFIGPGILFNDKESLLKGRAKDNKEVVGILVEELDSEGSAINRWDEATIGPRGPDGWQEWSIPLHGIRKGERVINITALDKPKNVGPETVKQLTLLVDTDDPIVESVTIERKPGIQVGLLPREILQGMSHTEFSEIDYFQNELFTLRASIVHDFALEEVWLNFIDKDDKEVLPAEGTARGMPSSGGTLYTPYWEINAARLIAANPELAAGKHYLNVVITARAKAGHTGSGSGEWEIDETGSPVNSDILYSLCWYPEADIPHIEISKTKEPSSVDAEGNKTYRVAKGGMMPVNMFDDDNLHEVYATAVPHSEWAAYMPGKTDEEKLEALCAESEREAFNKQASGADALSDDQRHGAAPARSAVIPVKVGSGAEGMYKLIVLAVDTKSDDAARPPRWGHAIFDIEVFEEEFTLSLATITCDSPDGSWPAGEELVFKLIFNGKVYNTDATSTYIELEGGASGSAVGGATTIPFGAVGKEDAKVFLEARWTPEHETVVYNPVIVTEVKLGGVRYAENDEPVADPDPEDGEAYLQPNVQKDGNFLYVPEGSMDWLKREKLKVFTFAPFITHIEGAEMGEAVNSVVVREEGGLSKVALTFDRDVVAGNGVITVKPAPNWLVPPVLASEEYARVRGELPAQADLDTLTEYYAETTHGLKIEGGNYVPDTATKYVLNFTEELNHAALRPIFERAKYMWQELESANNLLVEIEGNKVTLDLEPLPIGRQWVIEIGDAAFLDEAGNETAGWDSGNASIPPPKGGVPTNCYFWSAETAAPVIRVNRVSNNHTGIGIARTPASNYISHPNLRPGNQRGDADEGPTDEITLRVNVQYRIDCETPGATITAGKLETLYANVANAGGSGGPNPAYNAPGPFDNATAEPAQATANSRIPDATAAQLGAIGLGNYTSPGTITNINSTNIATIGDTDMYTARKDYIAAQATRTLLSASEKAYEGAFKTVIVYRGKTLPNDKVYLATEGTNVRNGATTISGFPLTNNDFTGRTLKYCYRNGNANAGTTDWIWITWEIVSDFWHVGMAMVRNTPNGKFTQGEDPWQPWGYDHYNHNYRKYGNYGIRNRGD